MAAPVLSQVQYNGTLIRANFTYVDPTQQTFQIALFEGANTTPSQVASSGPLVATLNNPTMNNTSVWSVAIAAVTGGVVGPYSNHIAVVVGPPQNISVIYDGDALQLAWSPPAGATVVYGSTVSLINAATGDLLASASFDFSPAVYRPTNGLNPATSYAIKLAGASTTNSYGPYSAQVAVIQTIPAFSSLNYTMTDVDAAISANSSTVNPNNQLGIYLYADGSLFASAIAATPGNLVRLTLPDPLSPDSNYIAYLAYTITGGSTRGPMSIPRPVLIQPGDILAVTYDGQNVTALWEHGVGTPPPTGGYVEIDGTSGAVASGDTLGTNIVIPSPPLVANTPYTLKLNVQRGASLGPASQTVDVLTYLATPATVSYDGQNIAVTWSAVGGADVTGMLVALVDSGTVVQKQPGGSSGSTMLPAALSPSGTYDIKLQTVGDRTTGPLGAAAPVISVIPRVTGAIYSKSDSTSSVEIHWNAADISSAHGLTSYKVQLYENGAPLGAAVPVTGASTDHVTISLGSVLDPSKTHGVTVQAMGTNSAGPIGAQSPIITASPQFVSISYDGTNVTAKWTPVGQTGVSGYKVTVGSTTQTTSLTSVTFAFTPTNANPTISIIALGAMATGPSAGTTLLTATVDVKSTSYDGATLNASWLASTPPPAYVLEVLEGTNVVAAQVSTALQATLAIALSLSATYSVAVRPASTDGIVIGPRSTSAPVIVATPSISNVAYDGTNVTGTVTAPSGVTLDTTTLKVSLYANGIIVGSPVSASGGTFTIPVSGTAGASLTVRASLTGTKNTVAITAPLSSPIPILTAKPFIDSALLSFDGTNWNLTAAWSLPQSEPPVGKFTVVLSQDGTAVNTWTVSGRSLTVVAATFDVAKTLNLVITPNGNYGSGPASAAATFVPTSTGTTTSVVDGDRLTVNWTDVAGTSLTAHRLRLVQQAGALWLTVATGEVISGTTGFIQIPSSLIETDAVYGVTIDAAMGTAWTAANQISPVIVQMPSLKSAVSTSASSVNITWDPPSSPSGIDGYLPVMVWEAGTLPLDALPASPANATLTIPATVPNGAWITLAATKGQTTGPICESISFISEVVSEVTVGYDGTTISAAWNAAEDSRVSAYEVTFTVKDQAPVTETVTTNSWSKAFVPTTGQTASVSVRMLAGSSKSPATGTVNAILNQPSITKAAFNGSQLALTWSPVSDSAASEYVIEVVSGGKVMAAYTSGGTSATIPFAASANTIQIRAIGSAASGPSSTAFTPITTTPTVTSVAFDTSGSLTIEWGAIAGAGRYKVQFMEANEIVLTKNPTTNSLTLTAAELPPSGIYDITVQPFASVANDDVSGPISASLPGVVLSPPDVEIAYDGRTARITWEPITATAITGYLTTILNGATVVGSATTVGPAASIEVNYASTNNYYVVVQALTSAGAGQPSPQAALFQPGWYASTATNAAPHIIPATVAAMSNYDILVYLPNIFTTYVSTGLPTDPPFVFSTTSTPPYSYKLTMPANSAVWTFNADSIRADIVSAYQTLQTNLVQLNVTPLGWRMVQDAISRAMPQTFAETLYYGYAFVAGDGYVDLKPGMLLRADFESYQYLGPDQTVSAYVDGFVSSSSAFYDVGSYVSANGQWLTGFDAFLSQVTQSGSTVPPPQTTGSTASGGGGIIDLYYTQFRKPYVRLVYPPQLLNDSTADARVSFNVAVLAASDYSTLATATQNLRNAQPLPSGVAATYLRGRTTISACIRVWLDEQSQIVPVGSSVGNLLENMGRRAPVVIPQTGNPGIPLSGIVVERSTGYAVSDPSDYSISKGTPIRLDWNQGMAYSATTDWLSLPLLPGDRITTRGNE